MREKGGAEVGQQRHRSLRAYLRIEGIIPRNPLAVVPSATGSSIFFLELKKGRDFPAILNVASKLFQWSSRQRCS